MQWVLKVCIAVAAALLAVSPTVARASVVTVSYDAKVLGVVPLGRASLSVRREGQSYTAAANLRTEGLAQLFDDTRLRARAFGVMAQGAPTWTRFVLEHNYANKRRDVTMTRQGFSVSTSITPPHRDMGLPPASASEQGRSFDPLTALAMLGVAVGRANACPLRITVFDGRQHYALALSGGARTQVSLPGYRGSALQCTLRYTPISGFPGGVPREAAPLAQVWFATPAPDGYAPLVRLAVPTPLGDAVLEATALTRE